MLNHLTSCHNIEIETQDYTFSSVAEFEEWRNEVEEECKTRFRKRKTKSSKHHTSGKYFFFVFEVYNFNQFFLGGCIATFVKTHVGHRSDFGHTSLSKNEKEEIAKKIAEKIPFANILDEIRDSVVNSNLKRVHLTTKKDLFNIEHAYQLAHPPTWHKNDAISIEAEVNSMKEQGECVLFFISLEMFITKIIPSLKMKTLC
uniref:Uncharacterized protein LOC114346435 n=1 Tax=Diabrotica virgifera virgifera TaxID=50390 RepID=A0A6P7H378_DIAVI